MTTMSGGQLIARMIAGEGVRHVFTLSGLHVAPIYDGCLSEGVAVVDTRHEQAAAHAADAYARLTRGIGVAVVTAGPGVTDAITGVANAKAAESPVLLIGGAAPQALSTKGALQETEQVAMFRPITKHAQRCERAELLPQYVATAIRAMTTGRPGPAFLEVPWDLLAESGVVARGSFPKAYRPKGVGRLADEALVARAAERLAAAERPVIMCGNGVHWDQSAGAVLELARKLDAPIFFNGMARSCFDVADPHVFQKARREAFIDCDAILVLGAPLDFRLGYGGETTIAGGATLIAVDVDGSELGRNRDVDVPLIGDTLSVTRQLERHAPRAEHAAWIERLRAVEARAVAKQRAREASDALPITHFRYARGIADALTEDTIVIGDGGNVVSVASKVIDRRLPGTWLDPGPFGCLGVGAPFALAAKLLYPERPVVVVQGDGSFGLNGFDYDTCLRFGCPVTAVVGNDAAWGQIWLPQKLMYGEERAVGTKLRPTRYDKVMEALGGVGFHVERPEELTPAVRSAMASGTIACVDVAIDPLHLEKEGGGAYAI
jgi:acetolactate synthase-1/2/3 large subunit